MPFWGHMWEKNCMQDIKLHTQVEDYFIRNRQNGLLTLTTIFMSEILKNKNFQVKKNRRKRQRLFQSISKIFLTISGGTPSPIT